ncbi:Hypothetical predicted protein, partial [Paramuricea clavata]
ELPPHAIAVSSAAWKGCRLRIPGNDGEFVKELPPHAIPVSAAVWKSCCCRLGIPGNDGEFIKELPPRVVAVSAAAAAYGFRATMANSSRTSFHASSPSLPPFGKAATAAACSWAPHQLFIGH